MLFRVVKKNPFSSNASVEGCFSGMLTEADAPIALHEFHVAKMDRSLNRAARQVAVQG